MAKKQPITLVLNGRTFKVAGTAVIEILNEDSRKPVYGALRANVLAALKATNLKP